MGREAVAVCRWQGETAEVKALLEGHEIILRGDIRARISRASISSFLVEGETLFLVAGDQQLGLELGQVEAQKWAAVLGKPLPTLAEKIGVDALHPAFVSGEVKDAALAEALAGAVTNAPDQAAILIAILIDEADLAAAIKLARAMPHCPIWCIYGKGKHATVSDSTIRSAMRASGFIDNKTSSVSERMTATRYRQRAV